MKTTTHSPLLAASKAPDQPPPPASPWRMHERFFHVVHYVCVGIEVASCSNLHVYTHTSCTAPPLNSLQTRVLVDPPLTANTILSTPVCKRMCHTLTVCQCSSTNQQCLGEGDQLRIGPACAQAGWLLLRSHSLGRSTDLTGSHKNTYTTTAPPWWAIPLTLRHMYPHATHSSPVNLWSPSHFSMAVN